jgi:hypothetical protein
MPIVESVTTFGAAVGRISDIVQTGDTLTATGTVGPEPHSWIGQAGQIVEEGIKNAVIRAIGKHLQPMVEAAWQWVEATYQHASWHSVCEFLSGWIDPS